MNHVDMTGHEPILYINTVKTNKVTTMPRDDEIQIAFRQAIKRDAVSRYTISTTDFVKELERLNWHYTLRADNKWIEMHTTTFRDISPKEGEERVFQVFSPNG